MKIAIPIFEALPRADHVDRPAALAVAVPARLNVAAPPRSADNAPYP
jgi:hypothetical protein